ncbi:hypothetical protein PTSG_01405 [Salpingoeca rosetta]|uniref:Small GTP-binding protein n=1 Tax=Salpingoeca rosetta (strain ATCC 50818 / BSB-021) TaxID=946362 RepID=F2U091_SALR5|nr:uncharacterized protein PTSG_01405 [Salpingoeca rosetta]EGD80819.1 hypothetical protein PTSG_01405 [Salpingoeca rosetta]|eukprot:XP_004997380.1 hypothetical protein PTSG_01405 [Salpingoeca rosetta]
MDSIEAKVVLVGSQDVGKTSLVVRYVNNDFSEKVSSTVGASFFKHKINAGKHTIKLQIWDTAGEERFHSMLPMYYRGASAALLVYDVTNPKSLDDALDWINELRDNCSEHLILCLVANKMDLVEEGCDAIEEGRRLAQENDALFHQTSAKTGSGISETFVDIAKELIGLTGEETPSPNQGTVNVNETTEQKKQCC